MRNRSIGIVLLLAVIGAGPDRASAGEESSQARSETIPWTRQGVVLDLGEPTAFDGRGLESPTVVREAPDRLVMWYRGRSNRDKIGRIGRAVSRDGIVWERTGVVMEPEGRFEGNKIDPMTVLREDGIYKMWFGGQGKGGVALYATSPDGIRWTRGARNPALAKTRRDWDDRGAGGQHSVLHVGDRYEMFYKGFGSDPEGWTFYGRATSEDGERWKKHGRVISPDPSLGESTLFRNLFAFHRNDRYYLLHAMSGRENLNLRLLRSDDGESWERAGIAFAKGRTPGDLDRKWATSPTLLFENGRVRMWYEGGDPRGTVRLLYAETSEQEFLARANADVEASVDDEEASASPITPK